MVKFFATNKPFQFIAMILGVAAAVAHGASIEGSSELTTLLYGLPIGYLVAELWVASLLHGETKQWTWLPVLRGRLDKREGKTFNG